MKKISIIIPIYNTKEFLSECIDSVINQTYSNLEIILINDGSNSSCKEAIESIASNDSRIKYIHLDQRSGVGAARNMGLDRSTGDYVYFLDSDDYIPQNTIELLIENINNFNILSGVIKKTHKKNENDLLVTDNNLIQKEAVTFFKSFSIIHCLISNRFIKKHELRFSEDVDCFSELSFIMPLIASLETIPHLTNCLYYKRTRNDPISNPSLMQLDLETRINDFLTIFNKMKEKYMKNELLNNYLDKQFLNFYRKDIVMHFIDQSNIHQNFKAVTNAVEKLSISNLKNRNPLLFLEMFALKKKKANFFNKTIRLHHLLRDLKHALSGRTKFYIYLYNHLFSRLPLKEKTIVFESFLGKNYSDSPKNIYEYMISKSTDYKFIWIFNQEREIPGNAKQVKRFSLAYYYYLATSKFWVSNSRLPLHLKKREGNIYLQTWHGTPLKKLVFDMEDIHSANPNYKSHFFKQSRRWDYLISANQYSSDIFRSAFKFEKEMLEFGYPRNDILHSNNKEDTAAEIKKNLGLPTDKKIILYAPTWRDDEFYEPGKYKFNLKLDLHEMKKKLGNDYIVLLRMHYFIADNIEISGLEDFAFNLSKYNDIAELYLISDILITDYSSVFFDYSNLRRPILFFTYDLEKYRDTLRGFYIDMEKEVPGPLLKTTEEIIDSILNIEDVEEKYRERYQNFYDRICQWEKGNATEQVVKQVFKI
ncbi:CDP-glycerol:poly(glycerophosphate) glycerophosphotransferase [Bacillus sp. ZZV12-4809]|nr:CDP-glycerol:poly(glycerophosphate) glycerophosphotransferase [Bacillus sp. ZZV12-4809]